MWPNPGQIWPISGRSRPTFNKSGQIRSNFGPNCNLLAESGPTLAGIRPKSVEIVRVWPKLGTIRSNFCRHRQRLSTSAKHRPKSDQIWLDSAESVGIVPRLAKIWSKLGKTLSKSHYACRNRVKFVPNLAKHLATKFTTMSPKISPQNSKRSQSQRRVDFDANLTDVGMNLFGPWPN